MTRVQVAILGPVEVQDDGRAVPVTGSRVRRLLTRLALDAPRAVGPTALADAVWGDDLPAELTNALQSLVSRLRRALGGAHTVLATPGGGYRLDVAGEDVDVHRVEKHLERARAEQHRDPAEALAELDDAAALWRGQPLADLADGDAVTADVTRLTALRDQVAQLRLEILIRAGQAETAALELAARAEAAPADERETSLLMSALVASGRPAEALSAYQRLRHELAEALGVDPSTELQQQHLAILRGEAERPEQPAVRGNLPSPVSSFLGRDDDISRLGLLVTRSRLVTLVGPGGSGKTRLAIEAARLAAPHIAGGAWLVELAKVSDPGDVVTAVVDAVGAWDAVPLDRGVERHAVTPLDRLKAALQPNPALLVLDNCEHLIDAAATLAEEVLGACPELRVLATSREPLAVNGESLFPVPPLAHDTADLGLEQLAVVPAVQLFVDRAGAADPSFELTTDNAADVAEICRRLDGLPLALELAAARTRSLPVDQIARRLGDRFRLLTGGSRTALPRHRTLQAVVEWSWDLLGEDERDLTERLAVFAGGISPEAARCVVEHAGLGEADELLAALVDKSLLQLREGPRYRMLETIREYGTDRLAERGILREARETHAAYFSALMKRIEPLMRSRGQLPWIALAATERDNVLSAVQYLCDRGEADQAVALAGSLAWLWTLRGEHAAAMTWLQRAMAVPGGTWTPERVVGAGMLAMNTGATQGDEAGREVVERYAEHLLVDPQPGQAGAVVLVRALVPIFLRRNDDARSAVDKSLAVVDDPWTRGFLLMVRGFAEENDGEVTAMRATIAEAQAIFEELGERFGLASVIGAQARLHTLDGDLQAAIDTYTRAGQLEAELGAEDDSGQAVLWSAQLYARRGELAAAEEAVAAARTRFERIGSWLGMTMTDATASLVARQAGDPAAALRLAERAETSYNEGTSSFGPGQMLAMTLIAQGLALVDLGELDTAHERLIAARRAAVESSDMPVIAETAVALAVLAVATADLPAAADMLGSADALRGNPDPTEPDVIAVSSAVGHDDALVQRRARAAAAGREAALDRVLAVDPAADRPERAPLTPP